MLSCDDIVVTISYFLVSDSVYVDLSSSITLGMLPNHGLSRSTCKYTIVANNTETLDKREIDFFQYPKQQLQ